MKAAIFLVAMLALAGAAGAEEAVSWSFSSTSTCGVTYAIRSPCDHAASKALG